MVKLSQYVSFNTAISKSSLCDYGETDLLVKGTTTVAANTAAEPDGKNKQVIFENCAPFTECMSEITNTQVDHTNDIDALRPKEFAVMQ